MQGISDEYQGPVLSPSDYSSPYFQPYTPDYSGYSSGSSLSNDFTQYQGSGLVSDYPGYNANPSLLQGINDPSNYNTTTITRVEPATIPGTQKASATQRRKPLVEYPGLGELFPQVFFGRAAVEEKKARILNERVRPVMTDLQIKMNNALRDGKYDEAQDAVNDMYALAGQFPQIGPWAQQQGNAVIQKQSQVATNNATLDMVEKLYKDNPEIMGIVPEARKQAGKIDVQGFNKMVEGFAPKVFQTDTQTRVSSGYSGLQIGQTQLHPGISQFKDYPKDTQDAFSINVMPTGLYADGQQFADDTNEIKVKGLDNVPYGRASRWLKANQILNQPTAQAGGASNVATRTRLRDLTPEQMIKSGADVRSAVDITQTAPNIPGQGPYMPQQQPGMPQNQQVPPGSRIPQPQGRMAPQGQQQPLAQPGNVDQAVSSAGTAYQPQSDMSTYVNIGPPPERSQYPGNPAGFLRAQEDYIRRVQENRLEIDKLRNQRLGQISSEEQNYYRINPNTSRPEIVPKRGRSSNDLQSSGYLPAAQPSENNKFLQQYNSNAQVLLDAFQAVKNAPETAMGTNFSNQIRNIIDYAGGANVNLPLSIDGHTISIPTLGGTITMSSEQAKLWNKLVTAAKTIQEITPGGNQGSEEMGRIRQSLVGAFVNKGTALETLQTHLGNYEQLMLGRFSGVQGGIPPNFKSIVPEIPEQYRRTGITGAGDSLMNKVNQFQSDVEEAGRKFYKNVGPTLQQAPGYIQNKLKELDNTLSNLPITQDIRNTVRQGIKSISDDWNKFQQRKQEMNEHIRELKKSAPGLLESQGLVQPPKPKSTLNKVYNSGPINQKAIKGLEE